MADNHAKGFAPAHQVDLIEQSVSIGHEAGVILETADPVEYLGRHVEIRGQKLLNFGSCSYLGLDQDPELVDGARRALERFGTQFSFSRTYLENPLYSELEDLLRQVTGAPTLVTPTTTLGHVAAIPVLVEPGDIVIIDHSAHASLHTACALLRGVTLIALRHSRIDRLKVELEQKASLARRVWYIFDGLYSMLGDLAPLDELLPILERFDNLWLYADDAHATSWSGRSGRGSTLDVLQGHPRVVVALSLNKAFSAAGGALVVPNQRIYDRVRRCGGPLIFSGPIQPPLLGAAVASARLHLSAKLPDLQSRLQERIRTVIQLAETNDVSLANDDMTPIFFVTCGPMATTLSVIKSLRARGIYACPSFFPAVPKSRTGIRFTVSLHNELSDIAALMAGLSETLNGAGVHPVSKVNWSSV